MLIWTVLPIEMVLDGVETPPLLEEIDYAGAKVIVEKMSPIQARITRIISTNPDDFLRPDIQPGTVLVYKPTAQAV